MEAVNPPADDNHTTQVIEFSGDYGTSMVLASRYTSSADKAGDSMTLKFIGTKVRSYHLSNDAMTALVKLWRGDNPDMDAVMADAVCVSSENEALRSEIAQLMDQNNRLMDDREERDQLRAELATLRTQESFRVALLESVASAARVIDNLSEDNQVLEDEYYTPLHDALANLDAWQPDDATPDVSAIEATV